MPFPNFSNHHQIVERLRNPHFYKFKIDPRTVKVGQSRTRSSLEFYPENTFESGTINIVLWHFSQDSMNTAMKCFNFWQWIGINWDTYNYKGRFYSQFRLITYQYKRCKTFLIFDIVVMVLVLLQPHQQPYQLR